MRGARGAACVGEVSLEGRVDPRGGMAMALPGKNQEKEAGEFCCCRCRGRARRRSHGPGLRFGARGGRGCGRGVHQQWHCKSLVVGARHRGRKAVVREEVGGVVGLGVEWGENMVELR